MITPPRKLLFVGTSALATEPSVHAFYFESDTGVLNACGTFTGLNKPTFLVTHPNERWFYAASSSLPEVKGGGVVSAFHFVREPFAMQVLNQQVTRGEGACHLQLDGTSCWVLVSNYNSGSVEVFPLEADGSLGARTDFRQHEGQGGDAVRQKTAHAHSAIFSLDNRFVIVADLGMDALVTYQFDAVIGKLKPQAQTKLHPRTGPRHMVFHPNGKWLYVANELANTVTLFDYDIAKGVLNERQTLNTLPSEAGESAVADIHLSVPGYVYVSNRGHNSLAIFKIGADGTLTLKAITPCGGNWPRNFALAPEERFVLVANQYSNEVCVMPLNALGALGEPLTRATVGGASCIQFV